MTETTAAVRAAARGMAAIASVASSDTDRTVLAYVGLYACGYTGTYPLETIRSVAAAAMDAAFAARMVHLAGGRRLDPGWTRTGRDGRRVFIEKDGIRAWTTASRDDGSDGQAELTAPAVAAGSMPGFLVREGTAKIEDQPVSRLYLHIPLRAAAWALGPLARELDARRLPFVLKVLAHPRAYRRRDACVIYAASNRLFDTFSAVQAAILRDGAALRPGVPLLTRTLAHGIGFADDPAENGIGPVSHGQWVSRLFLTAARRTSHVHGASHVHGTSRVLETSRVHEAAHAHRAAHAHEIAAEVLAEIRSSGRDPARPHLRPGRRVDPIPPKHHPTNEVLR